MDPESLSRFDVALEEGELVLRTTGALPAAAEEYLHRQLGRLNRFKEVGTFRGARAVSIYDPPLPSAAGKRGLVGRLERVFLKRRFPACATLAVTYACQCDCVHCSCATSVKRRPHLSTDAWKRIVDAATELGVTSLIYTGGEPILRPDIVELVEHVDKERATITIFSNGEKLTRELADRLAEAGLYAVFLSIDSADPETHDRLRRRPGLFDKLVAAARGLREAGLIVGFSTYLSHQKLAEGELDRIMALGRELGVGEVTQFDAVPTGRLAGRTELMLTEDDHEAIRRQTLESFKDPAAPSLTSQSLVNSGRSMGCFAAFNQLYVTAYGEVCPCDFTPISFGDATVEPLAEIWARMTTHPHWRHRSACCRMQSPELRALTVDRVPAGAPLPFPIGDLPDD